MLASSSFHQDRTMIEMWMTEEFPDAFFFHNPVNQNEKEHPPVVVS